MSLTARWLARHGAPDPAAAAAIAAARAARYDAPVSAMWAPIVEGMDQLGPWLGVAGLRRAAALSDRAFDDMDSRLHTHASLPVRLAWLLVRAPLLEARYAEPAPPDPGHPLLALAEELRARSDLRNDTFDVIVVGSGAGGAPLARDLAQAGRKVAVIEAGGLLTSDTAAGALERHYVQQGMLGSIEGGGMALVVAGRAVGGTTVVNSGTSLAPLPTQLEAWDRTAGTRFADGGLDPFVRRVQEELGIRPVPERHLDASARLVREGLRLLGREGAFPLPRNAPDCDGAGRCCFGCPNGAKKSTDRAFLPDAVRAGATLLMHTTALAVRADASGVEVLVRTPTTRRRLRAKELVLAGGALGTPGLIRSSRLGERWRQAGDALRIHPASKVFGWMPEPLPHGGVPQALGYRPPELPRVTFEGAHTPPAVTGTVLQLGGQRHRDWMAHHDHLANYGLMVRDRATGSVRSVAGRNVLRYTLHDEDATDLGSGLLIAAEVLFAAGAERVALPIVGAAEVTRSELRQRKPTDFTRKNLLTSGFHPQGTAGIGRVVDTDLALIGAPHVWVCDASVLPDSPGVNPQVTLMALSFRLAGTLLEKTS
jgi:choline dehydrogenase-like flavoprotein